MSGPTVRELLAALDDVMQGRRLPSDTAMWLRTYREERAQRCHSGETNEESEMSDQQIELLEMAIERAGLKVVDARCLSLSAIGEVTAFMSGQYGAYEIQSILDDVKRVQHALARIQR